MRRSDRWFHIVALLTIAVFGLSLAVVFPRVPTTPIDGRQGAELRADPPPITASETLTRGRALSEILAGKGLDAVQIREVTRLVGSYRSPRTLRPGVIVGFAFDPLDSAKTPTPNRIRLALNPDSIVDLVRSDEGWSARLELVPFVMDTVRVSGLIESSLWSAKLGGDLDRLGEGEFEELVYDLADIYAWEIDFTRDLRKGDVFRLAFERKVRPDGSVRSRHFLAIEIKTQERLLRAIPLPRARGGWAYFDERGHSLHGAFLRYPVPYRITSRFTNRRYHPVLQRYRRHEGIDYGAPYGTPVEATASGIVSRAGYAGGYGRVVELRHAGGIRTRYAHLSAFGPGIRSGTRVEQGAVIGRVGASGLATGPHLHYEFLLNGRHVDPLTVEVPSQPSLTKKRLAEFHKVRDGALALIDGVPIPYDFRIALDRRR